MYTIVPGEGWRESQLEIEIYSNDNRNLEIKFVEKKMRKRKREVVQKEV